jgi:hypothetical protein
MNWGYDFRCKVTVEAFMWAFQWAFLAPVWLLCALGGVLRRREADSAAGHCGPDLSVHGSLNDCLPNELRELDRESDCIQHAGGRRCSMRGSSPQASAE